MKTKNLIYLINPGIEKIERDRPVSPPLGICSLASYSIERGLRNFMLDDCYLNDIQNIGKNNSHDLIKSKIIKNKPLVFGASIISGAHLSAFELLEFAKKNGCITIAGGVDATIHHERYAKSGFIDYVIRGEGEYAFAKLLEDILKNSEPSDVPNLTYLKNEKLIVNPPTEFLNLDEIPSPAFYLLSDFLKYSQGRAISIEDSRGCLYNCSFCAIKTVNKKIRLKSSIKIKEELGIAIKKYSPLSIRFVSENVLLEEERAKNIIKIMSDYKIPWMLNAYPHLINMRSNLLSALVESGLETLEVGIESGSNNILRLFNKSTTVKENELALKAIYATNIKELRLEYIMFNPLMTYKDLIDSFEFIEKNFEIFIKDSKFPKQLFTEMYVEEGTPFFDLVKNKGMLKEVTKNRLKMEFESNYLDERVLSVKNKLTLLKEKIKKNPNSLSKEGILKEYKKILYNRG
jgi:radical SAM superfamily enzyme YgiQ (UPF0313 family)